MLVEEEQTAFEELEYDGQFPEVAAAAATADAAADAAAGAADHDPADGGGG